jgi:hypothetical protein
MVECPECGAGADMTKDGLWAHCASCRCIDSEPIAFLTSRVGNTVFEPGKDDSHYKGSGSGSGDKEEVKKGNEKGTQKDEGSKS